MHEYDLNFSCSSSTDGSSYKLVELPPDLVNLLQSAADDQEPTRLTIKGLPGEDAVLCTSDKTYAIRSVVLSNTILVVTAPQDSSSDTQLENQSEQTVVIRDQLNEILELQPAVPKLYKLTTLLRGQEYDEGQVDQDAGEESFDENQNALSYEEASAQIQASDAELVQGLKDRHILIINNQLRPIAPAFLSTILELLLNLLVSLSLSHKSASVEVLSSPLSENHDIPRRVSTQVMSWFGEIVDGKWSMNVDAVLRQIGLELVRSHQDTAILKAELLLKWKEIVGDTFESSVRLGLLSGNYLIQPNPYGESESLKYFPASSLPVDAAARFADLFRTRPRWKADEISPFLADIAVNSKERDKLLLKYARSTTDSLGVWYTARATYNG